MSDATENPWDTGQDPAGPIEEHRFPCPACGAQMEFAPGGKELICPNCGYTEEIDPLDGLEKATAENDFHAALRQGAAGAEIEETRVVTCPNCGAQTAFGETVQAATCPFCDTPLVMDTGTHRHIKPAAVLPFGIDERTARGHMTDWLGALWFAPNGLKDYARKGRAMTGIYVPYWTYDTDTRSRYTGSRGTYYYVSRTVTRDGKRQTVRERRTRWASTSGRVARFFDDVLILASNSLPQEYTDRLAPWDLSELAPYRPEFLAGFAAEGYQVELAEGYEQAQRIMDAQIVRDVRADIGGDEQRVGSVNTAYDDITFKHILLPVWLAAYKYRGRTFRFVVNARTGKVQGERPYSKWKIALAILCGLIVAGIVGTLMYLNQS